MSYTRIDHDYNLFSWKQNSTTHQGPTTVDFTKTRTGQKVENWRDKVQAGTQAGSPYSVDSTKVAKRKDGAATLVWENKFTPGVRTTDVYVGQKLTPTTVAHLSISTTEAENRALKLIIKKIREESSHFNGSTVLGELTKTIHGLKHPYETLRHKIADHLGTLKKRKGALEKLPPRKREKAWRDVIASTWLETNFGMKPVISDVKSIAESIARFEEDQDRKARLQSKARFSTVALLFDASNEGQGYLQTRRLTRTETTAFCSYSVGIKREALVHKAALDRLRTTLGFTLENFVPTLYEIAPWSWFVDYFTNLGDLIEAGTTNESDIEWIVKTVGRKTKVVRLSTVDRDLTIARVKSGGDKFHSLTGSNAGQLILQRMSSDRTLPATLGMPKLSFTYPGKGMQIANLTAILAQFSGKTFSPEWENRVRAPYEHSRQRARGVHRVSDFLN